MSSVSLAFDNSDLAAHYEQVSADRQLKAGQALIGDLGVAAGERVLDVGAGTGLLAACVADLVGPSGSVVGIDPLPLRIEIARGKTQPNLIFEVGNAYDLSRFAEASFDVVYLNAVFHWLPEKREPLRQIARVLKPGGRLGITTGSKDHPNQLQAVRRKVLAREPYARYPEGAQGTTHRVDMPELEALLVEAGFAVRKIELRPTLTFQPNADAAIRFSEASSFGNFLGHLPDPIRAAARHDIVQELETLRTPDGIRQESARIFAIAVKC